MSELIQKHDNRATIRWKLLTGASALALTAYVSSSALAKAEDATRPTIWIDLGATLNSISGIDERFDAPFMHLTPTPDPYKNGGSPLVVQKPPRFSIDENLALSFQPEQSDWVFSAGIKYGRSHRKLDRHHQTFIPTYRYPAPKYSYYQQYYPSYQYPPYRTHAVPVPKFADTTVFHTQRHMIVDFQAGRDVGLGMFGHGGTSVLSAGVRLARFSTYSDVTINARPNVTVFPSHLNNGYVLPYANAKMHTYYLHGQSARSFNGVGPSVSWKASVPIAGEVNDGQLSIDFGINGAILFGRQKAKTSHHTKGYYKQYRHLKYHFYPSTHNSPLPRTVSRNVSVPNVGADIGITYRLQDAKFSLGYRYDTFLNAMDMGIDARKATDMTFQGPYASISIGIGD